MKYRTFENFNENNILQNYAQTSYPTITEYGKGCGPGPQPHVDDCNFNKKTNESENQWGLGCNVNSKHPLMSI